MPDPLQTPSTTAATAAPASPPPPTTTSTTSDPLADALKRWSETRDARLAAEKARADAEKAHGDSEVLCRSGLAEAGHDGPDKAKRVGDALFFVQSGQVVRVAIPAG